jgi:hypothetical protein
MRHVHTGSCHCGRLSVEYATRIAPEECVPRACQCSFCRKHSAAYFSDPQGKIELKTSGLAIDIYRMGLLITDFHVCHQCGVLVAATWEDSESVTYAVVNSRSLDRAQDFPAAPVIANFDGEGVEDRQARRRKGWTPASIIFGGG